MSSQELVLYDPHFSSLPQKRQGAWAQFFQEIQVALRAFDGHMLREWARRSLVVAVEATIRRAAGVWNLVKTVAGGVWQEIKALWNAVWEGKLGEYVTGLCRRVWAGLKSIWHFIRDGAKSVRDFVGHLPHATTDELVGYGASLVGATLGFLLIGGRGDGGVIDMDIMTFGIGGHRSIWFHSALVGLAAEVCLRSSFELFELLHERLPTRHSPLWDRFLSVGRRFRTALVTGVWAGVATHLAVDSHLGGWTPYKDLPVSLPSWGHHLVMDVNAAAASWFGWQWHDKVSRRFRQTSTDGRSAGAIIPVSSLSMK